MWKTLRHLLLSVFVKSLTPSGETIDLQKKPHYLHMYGTHLVNFDTCDGFDFLNYVDDYGDVPDDECHVSQLELERGPTIIDQVKFYPTLFCPLSLTNTIDQYHQPILSNNIIQSTNNFNHYSSGEVLLSKSCHLPRKWQV